MALSERGKILIVVFAVIVIAVGIALACVYLIPKSTTPTPTSTRVPPSSPPAPPFVEPTPPGGLPIADQPSSSLQIINSTTQNPLQVSLQLDSETKSAIWVKLSGSGSLGPAVFGDHSKNPPNYQLVTLGLGDTIVVQLPDFTDPWRVTPLGNGGMPILVEGGKDLVTDMSAVDGVNYLMKMQLTSAGGLPTIIDFNTSPCPTSEGCVNPFVNGEFIPGTTFSSAPCPYGTCNLTGTSRSYSLAINSGQCSNVDSTWGTNGFSADCATNPRSYTTYSYSHADQNSSPGLLSPYKVVVELSDL